MSNNEQKVSKCLEEALSQWHQHEAESTLQECLLHLIRQTNRTLTTERTLLPQQQANHLLLGLLEALGEQDPEAARLLRLRYIESHTGYTVANMLGISESLYYRRRREALAALAHIAEVQEQAAWAAWVKRLESRLEIPTYHQPVGLDTLRHRLRTLLCDRAAPHRLICLTGIGGIGKTTLADVTARDMIKGNCLDDLAWVSARQQEFGLWGEIRETGQPALTAEELVTSLLHQLSVDPVPPRPHADMVAALKTRLAAQHHLLIVDNLETAPDYEAILPLLRELGQWASIILTSRVAIDEQSDVYAINLSELNQADAEILIRAEAARRQLDDLAAAPPEVMTRIYDIAGGNPLALKLLIGQVQFLSLPVILEDFNEARGRRVETLYDFIYRRAWDLLDEPARHVLLMMPLVASPGTTRGHLQAVSQVPYEDLTNALDQLTRLSLVNVGGTYGDRRYYIHRLTETFLHKQVTKWTVN